MDDERLNLASSADDLRHWERWVEELFNGCCETLSRQVERDEGGVLHVRATGREAGEIVFKAERRFDFDAGIAFHDRLVIAEELQDKDRGKRFMANSVRLYPAQGIEEIRIKANINWGAYAWARYGFIPTEPEWERLKIEVRRRAPPILAQFPHVGDGLDWILGKGPWAIGYLAAIPDEVTVDGVTQSIGRHLLACADWEGYLRFEDAFAMEHLRDYLEGFL